MIQVIQVIQNNSNQGNNISQQQNEQFNINPNTHAELDPILLQDDSLFGENGMCFGMSSSNYNNSNNNHQARSLLSRITPQKPTSSSSSQACGKPNALLALMEQRNQQRMNPTNVGSSSSPAKLSISQQIQQQMQQQQQHGTTITEPMDDTILNDDLLFERLLEFTETSATTSATTTNHDVDPYQPISMNLEPSPLWYE